MTTQVDDVPTSPLVSGRLRQPQQLCPVVVNADQSSRRTGSWFKTSFDDIGLTDVDDVVGHPSTADGTHREPSEFFARAHNTLRLSYRGYAARSDGERSSREDVVNERLDVRREPTDTDRQRTPSTERPRRNSVGTDDQREIDGAIGNVTSQSLDTADVSIDLAGKFILRPSTVDANKPSTSQNKLRSCAEPIDDRLLELTHRLATAAAAASFATSSPTASRFKSHCNDRRLHPSPSPPPLPASSPPRTAVAESTSRSDIFDDWSTLSDDVEDHVIDLSTEAEQTPSKRTPENYDLVTDRCQGRSLSDLDSDIRRRETTDSFDVDGCAENTCRVIKPDAKTRTSVGETLVKKHKLSDASKTVSSNREVDSLVGSITSFEEAARLPKLKVRRIVTSPSLNNLYDEDNILSAFPSEYVLAAAFDDVAFTASDRLDDATFKDVSQKLDFSSDLRHNTSHFQCGLRQRDLRVGSGTPSASALSLIGNVEHLQCDSLEGSPQSSTQAIRTSTAKEEDSDWKYRSSDVSTEQGLVDTICHSPVATSEESDYVGRKPRKSARPEPSRSSGPVPTASSAVVALAADELLEECRETALVQDDLQRDTTNRSAKSIVDLSSARGGSLVAICWAPIGLTTRLVFTDRRTGQHHQTRCVSASDCHRTDDTVTRGTPQIADIEDWSRLPAVGASSGTIPIGSSRVSSSARASDAIKKPSRASGRIGSTIIHIGPRWSDERRGSWNSSARETHVAGDESEPTVQSSGGSKRRFKRLKLHSSVITIKRDSALLTSTVRLDTLLPFFLGRVTCSVFSNLHPVFKFQFNSESAWAS